MSAVVELEVRGQEVAPGVFSTANALVIDGDLAFNEWRRLGERIEVTLERGSWALGDWRCYGDRFDGEYSEAMDAIDRAAETARRCAWVCRAFRAERRRPDLSFRHHMLVAKLSETEQDVWLNESERHGWSTRALEERLAERRLTGTRPPALSVRATGDVVGRFEARALALGVPAKDLALEVLELASQLPDPVATLEAAGAHRMIEAPS